jgi:hypothetical protein
MGNRKALSQSVYPPPQPKMPRGETLNFFVIDEIELARQLTIRTFDLFSVIRASVKIIFTFRSFYLFFYYKVDTLGPPYPNFPVVYRH